METILQLYEIFNYIGVKPEKNIQRILKHCCNIFKGFCSVYHRIDRDEKEINVLAGYNLPADFNCRMSWTGHICYEETIRKGKPVAIGDLERNAYELTDPNIRKYKFKSYLAAPVLIKEKPAGSLCVLDMEKRTFSPSALHIIASLAKLLASEEARSQARTSLKNSYEAAEKEVANQSDELQKTNEQLCQEIDERKRAETLLRESEKKYRELVQSANSIILRMDTDGNIMFINEFGSRFFGYAESEILNKNVVGTIVPEKDIEGNDLKDMMAAILNYPEQYRNNQNENIRHNGERVWIAWTHKAIRDDDGRVTELLSIGNDITDRKRMEEEILRIKKLESVAVLAGGIAHDYNNLLTIIMGNIALGQMLVTPGDKMFSYLKKIEEAALRSRDLTRNFIKFAIEEPPHKSPTVIPSLLRNTIELALNTSNVTYEFDVSDNLWTCDIDEVQISRAIHKIIINAWEAMPDGGIIKISAQNVFVNAETKKETPEIPYMLRHGRYIRISIEDQGNGIPEENIEKIFDPYFSTKARGTLKGMGLGLTIAHSRVRRHNGCITVKSRLGQGTTFEVYLPASNGNYSTDPSLISRLSIK